MMKIYLLILLVFLGGCAAAGSAASPEDEKTKKTTTTESVQEEKKETECRICEYDFKKYKGDLKKKEIEGLLLALNDEYLAIATYEKINAKFDDPRPFINIIRAEKRHASKLEGLFAKYGLEIPKKNPWIDDVPEYDSVKAACKASIDGEIANAALYERLMKSTGREDILFVYKNLGRASQENHKPAFERCTSRGGKGMGRGRGRGMGRGQGNQ